MDKSRKIELVRKWQADNADKVKEYRRRWREKNRDKHNQCSQRWKENNREHISKYNHEYYLRRKSLREEGQRVREKGVDEGERKDV